MATTDSIKVRIPDGILSLVDAYGDAIGSNRSETLRLLIHMALATDHVVGVIKRNNPPQAPLPLNRDLGSEWDKKACAWWESLTQKQRDADLARVSLKIGRDASCVDCWGFWAESQASATNG